MLGYVLFLLVSVHASVQQGDPPSPDVYQVLFYTDILTTPTDPLYGYIIIEVCIWLGGFYNINVTKVTRSLAPLGADRFYALVKDGFYNDCALFRVVPGFVLQFGISGETLVWWL